MRKDSKPVDGPVFRTRCRICDATVTNDPVEFYAIPQVHRRMWANPNDPPFTYTCGRCEIAAGLREFRNLEASPNA